MTSESDPSIDGETRNAITDLLIRYATGIDARDWKTFRSCFSDDCDADYGEIGHWHSGDEITAWMARCHHPLGPTLHRISNVTMARNGDGVQSRCYVHAIVALPDRSAVHSFGWYDDRIAPDRAGWRIAARRFTAVTTELHPPMA
jgi:3-phenylpropionate/cinnamic acid dioxygenase small subunit